MKKYEGLPENPSFQEVMEHLQFVFNAETYKKIRTAVYKRININDE